jgi:nitrite reductase/ring-hydroxylating ferredoxin subunit
MSQTNEVRAAATGDKQPAELAGAARGRGEDREALSKKYVVARAKDIPVGERLIVEVLGRSIGVFNVDGRFYAFLNRCPHGGAPLCRGDVVGTITAERPGELTFDATRKFLACPWHGWEFELTTGESWFDPARYRARAFHVDVEGGETVAEDVSRDMSRDIEEGRSEFVDPSTHRVKGPYQATMIPVDVEDDYVVLSLRRLTTAPASETGAR